MNIDVEKECRGFEGICQTQTNTFTKQVALNNVAVPMLPHEAALYEVGQTPGIPTTAKVLEATVSKAFNCRDACLKLLQDSRAVTLGDIKRVANEHSKDLLGFDEDCTVELDILNSKTEPLLVDKAHDMVLDIMPDEDTHRTCKEVFSALERLKTSEICKLFF